MRRTPLVLGTLSVVFGTITAMLMSFALLFGMPPSPDMTADERRYQWPSTAAFALLAFALVVVGVGLLRRNSWSRAAGIAWAIAAIAVVELEFYALGRIGPRTGGMYLTLAIEALFPAIMLVLLAPAR